MTLHFTPNPVHNTFESLGVRDGEIFTANDDCLEILEEILSNIVNENCFLRSFRRAVVFGQNIKKDLIPLLIHIRETNIGHATKIIETIIKILANLTIPIEYLLPIEATYTSDVGKHTIFELNRLLSTIKEAFTDSRVTKAVVQYMKQLIEQNGPLDAEQCESLNNCLLIFRNILYIPEGKTNISNSLIHPSMQNQIIWNLFSQNFDKIIIYLMSCPQKIKFSVSIVQLIALIYKDQHVGILQKLLNQWLEASFSESSEDNESNTSPPDQCSPGITSDPTSDSSDNGGCNRNGTTNNQDQTRGTQCRNKSFINIKRKASIQTDNSTSSGVSSMGHGSESQINDKSEQYSESSSQNMEFSNKESGDSSSPDFEYNTKAKNQESISTSSNEDDQPHQKPVHQKPHNLQKTRYTPSKNRTVTTLESKELRRKKLVKRIKTNNVTKAKGLMHHVPTDEDIAHILKEFTVHFLLKGYGVLVEDLHQQLLNNINLQIDTSHFFWLVTYFLKFAIQLELDTEHVFPVLSCDIVAYLVFQGVWISEELEMLCKMENIDLKPCLRRQHLVVTAVREFIQAVESYQKMIHVNDADRKVLVKLQRQISEMKEIRLLFVFLLRQYNPKLQSMQYLKDLILTNHSLVLFLDKSRQGDDGREFLLEHLKQFATAEIMKQYGILLENFQSNGEHINNCIFTIMHHVAGDLRQVNMLFQPSVLKSFSEILETDFELCDDWTDLIEYVIHKFVTIPRQMSCRSSFSEDNTEVANDQFENLADSSVEDTRSEENNLGNRSSSSIDELILLFRWTTEDKENLQDYYNESGYDMDTIENISKKYNENGNRTKTQLSIIRELLDQKIITEEQYKEFIRNRDGEQDSQNDNQKTFSEENHAQNVEMFENNMPQNGDIKVLKDYLYKENKGKFLKWLQDILLETCFVKLVLSNREEPKDYVMEPTVYYFSRLNLPIPVVTWTPEQTDILKQQPFILLLHKLGLFIPVDTGKIFLRIPNFWSAEFVFSIAQQLGAIDTANLKFNTKTLQDHKQEEAINPLNCSNNIFEHSTIRTVKGPQHFEPYPPYLTKLTIAIPENDLIPVRLTPPELSIADSVRPRFPSEDSDKIAMDCCPITDDAERNSICDTESMTSDLTRMCVSDEEDKVMVMSDKEDTDV